MGIWRQLLLISLLTLLIPWAGCQYVTEMEATLRQGQQEALHATAQTIAQMLSAKKQPLFNGQTHLQQTQVESNSYVMKLNGPIDVDGYLDDWGDDLAEYERHFASQQTPDEQLTFVAATDGIDLYLQFQVKDDRVVYRDPQLNTLDNGDRIVIEFYDDEQRLNRYTLSTLAPGDFRASYMEFPQTVADDPWQVPEEPIIVEDWQIQGAWQATPAGFNVELKIPRQLVGEQFAFSFYDSDQKGSFGHQSLGTIDESEFNVEYLLIYPAASVQDELAVYHRDGQRLRLVDQQGWLRAEVGRLYKQDALYEGGELPDNFGAMLLYRLYHRLLEHKVQRQSPLQLENGRIGSRFLHFEPEQMTKAFWYRPDQNEYLGVVFPIRQQGKQVGSLIIERQTDSVLELTNHALGRVFYINFLTVLSVVVALLGFAMLLSYRIRRLSRRAEKAIGQDGRMMAPFVADKTQDEIGDLSRQFADVLERLKDYNEYLQGLSGKLSHELRTPLAVVRSSLENLEHCALDAQSQVYTDRAKQGVERLSAILSAMSEATRVEQVLKHSEKEWIDLSDLVRNMGQAYQDLHPQFNWRIQVDSGCTLQLVPELIVQMLDKLVDNACDFTPEQGRIQLQLRYEFNWAILRLCNQGELLPVAMGENLFDSLVSIRSRQDSQQAHLGFGLFIVRLIADFHQGEVKAYNQTDESGVCFEVKLPVQ